MVEDPGLQVVLTVAFAVTAIHSAVRIVLDRAPLLIVGNILHLVMSIVMVAMCWPWWSVLPVLAQLIVFGAGTVWFIAMAMLQWRRRIPRRALGGHSAGHQIAHALMMLAMVWMVLVMSSGSGGDAHAHHHGGLGPGGGLSGVALTAALLTSGVVFLVDLVRCLRGRTTWRGHTGDVAAGALMSLGMASMCWPMITG